jgi:hypothetical protein
MNLILVGFLFLGSASQSAELLQTPKYELELNFELAAKQFSCRATVQLPPSAIKDGTASFDISYSHWPGVSIERITGNSGRDLKYYVRDANKILEVELGGQQDKVTLEYSFPVDETSLEPYGYYKLSYSPVYPEVFQADGNSFRFSDFSVSLEYPSTLSVLTTGGEGELQRQENRITAKYVAEHVKGFAIVAGEGFEVTRREEGGVPVVAFYHPQYAEQFSTVIERTIEAASWYKKTYGFFPLEQVGIIQGHPSWGGGYPLPNMFAVHLGNLDDERITWITAHELGHYYWGYTVLGENTNMGWLQLALGIWADQLYLAERKGVSMLEQWRRGLSITRYLEAVVANHEQRLGLMKEEEQRLSFDYNSLIRHGKAATGLYLQSLLVGPERFLDLERQLLEAYRHRPLPEDEFVTMLEESGAGEASAFFEAWKRGDATIGLAVDGVDQDSERGGWRISLRRTGLVPYPVEVEAVSATGEAVRHIVDADVKQDTAYVAFSPAIIRLDPQGFIPMWNSAHPEMRSAFARALERAQLYEPFVVLAQAILAEIPEDDYLRYRLVRRLFLLGRWDEVAALWPSTHAGESRNSCRAAIYSAWALARMGRQAEAVERLDLWRESAEQYGVLKLWSTVSDETTQ